MCRETCEDDNALAIHHRFSPSPPFLFQPAFGIPSLFPTAGLGTAADEGAVPAENAIDPLWAAAAFVVDVVGRAGRIVAGVNREPGVSTFVRIHLYVYCTMLYTVL